MPSFPPTLFSFHPTVSFPKFPIFFFDYSFYEGGRVPRVPFLKEFWFQWWIFPTDGQMSCPSLSELSEVDADPIFFVRITFPTIILFDEIMRFL